MKVTCNNSIAFCIDDVESDWNLNVLHNIAINYGKMRKTRKWIDSKETQKMLNKYWMAIDRNHVLNDSEVDRNEIRRSWKWDTIGETYMNILR